MPRARLSRWAIVGSGTKNAAAISAAVSPDTERNVSATCEDRVSAGWQQSRTGRGCRRPPRRSMSEIGAAGETCRRSAAPRRTPPRGRPGRGRRRVRSISRREATRITSPSDSRVRRRGSTARPPPRAPPEPHPHSPRESPCRRNRAPRTCGDSRRHTSSDAPRRSLIVAAKVHDGTQLDRVTGPGEPRRKRLGAPGFGRDLEEAGQVFLGLRVRAVGDQRASGLPAVEPRALRSGQAGPTEQLAALRQWVSICSNSAFIWSS